MMTNKFHHIQCSHTGEDGVTVMKEEDCGMTASKKMSFQLMISLASSRLVTLPANHELVAIVFEATSLIPKFRDIPQSIPNGKFLVIDEDFNKTTSKGRKD
ncbi:hypothetical protein DUI87_10216 [Hirundo rustica rustica]|uniref:Uncharacterized protein n=1 Tax=Hirundo rustica rustica TaxID=333673 RepID=A0A3M0KJ72_HIRRU|nr:hypothetical protein DUI87_10216 [Hirundo rustica rustica]